MACILAFGTGCFCALKRTRRKATKVSGLCLSCLHCPVADRLVSLPFHFFLRFPSAHVLQIVSIRSIGTISSQNSLEENKSPKKAQTPSPAATEYHTPKPPESQPRCPPHTHTSYMWNPMCTIDCTSHACHGAGAAAGVEGSATGHEGSDNGERTIHITLSNSKIFGQSNSCSQFPDF